MSRSFFSRSSFSRPLRTVPAEQNGTNSRAFRPRFPADLQPRQHALLRDGGRTKHRAKYSMRSRYGSMVLSRTPGFDRYDTTRMAITYRPTSIIQAIYVGIV